MFDPKLSHLILSGTLVVHKVLVVLVDAVVGQVDKVVAHLVWVVCVLDRGESHEAVLDV